MTSYSGKIIRKTPVTPTQTSASGVWTTADAAAAVKNNLWPVPGVPDPISRSLRFRASATAYLTRTYGTPTNNKIWTWSAWIKRGSLSLADANHLFMASPQDIGSNPTTYCRLVFETDNTLRLQSNNSAGEAFTSNAVFRDPSAWYHIVLTMNAASTVVNCYVNGVEISYASRTNPTNTNTAINGSGNYHRMGLFRTAEPRCFDGYMAEVNFIDGQALTPLSFGTTNAQTGAWIPMPYTGTYGANGFYLNFKDNTSTTTLGYDYSGNANNWNTTNFSVTSGVTYDSMLDVPTSWIGYSATTDKSAVTRGNYAVLNPLWKGSGAVIANGNLSNTPTTAVSAALTTIPVSSGKWYAEISHTASNTGAVGMFFTADNLSAPSFSIGTTVQTGLWEWYDNGAGVFVTSDGAAFGSSIRASAFRTAGTFQFALDCDSGKFWFGKDGVWYNSTGGTTGDPAAGTNPTFTITATRGPFNFGVGQNTGYVAMYLNSGQRPFTYTPPTGFSTLCTTNISPPSIVNGASYMAATTYNGNSSSQSLTNTVNSTSFQPDLVWVKKRSAVANHYLWDSVRGALKEIYSNLTNAETTNTVGLSSFNSDGFTLNNGDSAWNASGSTYVGWQWKANGAAVSNTNGTITSQVSANRTAGFSVVTYTGTGSNATVGHGLGPDVAPSMIIVKSRSIAENWPVYHASMNASPASGRLILDGTAAFTASSTTWQSTAPTPSVFSIGTATAVNTSSATYVAYCFSAVTGYSKFGSYTGNAAADGPFIYTGFRPRFILLKAVGATSAGNWYIYDTSRETYNQEITPLWPNLTNAESANTVYAIDVVSNGFKIRTSASSINPASSETAIYAAFAETPFNYSNAR